MNVRSTLIVPLIASGAIPAPATGQGHGPALCKGVSEAWPTVSFPWRLTVPPADFHPRELAGVYELTVVATPDGGGPAIGRGSLVLEVVDASAYRHPFCFPERECSDLRLLRGYVEAGFPFPVPFISRVSPGSTDDYEPGVQGSWNPVHRQLDFVFGNPIDADGKMTIHTGAIFGVTALDRQTNAFGGPWVADDYVIPIDEDGNPIGPGKGHWCAVRVAP